LALSNDRLERADSDFPMIGDDHRDGGLALGALQRDVASPLSDRNKAVVRQYLDHFAR
jgi:hypothetical protein